MKEITEENKRLLQQVFDHFDEEDRSVRERQIRTWRQLKYLWEGLQRTYYSETAHDWRVAPPEPDDQEAYDKPINVLKAYLESIIAALSVTVPPIKCYPDDADDPLDLSTAKAGDKIASLIYKHNDVPLLWLHSLFIYCTEGTVACHTFSKKNKEYGTFRQNKYEDEIEQHVYKTCPNCGMEMSDELASDIMPIPEPEECENCGQMVMPDVAQNTLTVTKLVGYEDLPKARQCMEAYGGLNVKIPNYARKQEDCPYLILDKEMHYVNAIEKYGNVAAKFRKIEPKGSDETYERYARLPTQYQSQYPENVVTERQGWFRPCAFHVLEEQDAKKLRKLFPNGVKITRINDDFAEAIPEELDKHWTLTYNPLADHVHHDPLAMLLVSVQEVTNDIISLVIQTMEHGIPQTFADPSVLDFGEYQKLEATPGGITKTKMLGTGKRITDGFHEIKTATLSSEVLPFFQQVQSIGQLASGAQPSLFGGQIEGSETASEYSMSRAQALQRVQNIWKTFTFWWKNVFGKVIPAYIEDVIDDERDVQRTKDGNFINVFIRKAELEGKIGKVELEANENLPLTWSQRKDLVFQLLQSPNPQILEVLGSTENLPVIRDALGLTDFYVPNEDSRAKQYEEIKMLLVSEPIEQPPDPMAEMQAMVNGMPPPPPIEIPSVDIDPEFDIHPVEFEVIQIWVASDAGRLAKVENPNGHRNVLLHGKMHLMQIQMQMMQQQAAMGEGATPNAKPNEKDKPAPIMGEEDVSTTA